MDVRQLYDVLARAPNGLRRGRTTGSCATAAVHAATRVLLGGSALRQVAVSLPDSHHYLPVPIAGIVWQGQHCVRAEVIKDGGDDPDSTHGAIIFAQVTRNQLGIIRFFAAPGVGIASKPGLRVAVGEPAINPVPRAMMRQTVQEVLAQLPQAEPSCGFDLAIGCENGAEIARKTFNPRLGIIGGISILGTSGIVEPMSMASWIASIEVYVRVALAAQDEAPTGQIAYLPGKIGRDYAAHTLQLPVARSVQIANFLGESLDFTQTALQEQQQELATLWLLGHPGKLAKVLAGHWDTHSSKSEMAMHAVAQVAQEYGFSAALVQQMQQANTVEALMEHIQHHPLAHGLWCEIEQRIAKLAHARVPNVGTLQVRLFDLQGNALGEAA